MRLFPPTILLASAIAVATLSTAAAAPPGQITVRDVTRNYAKAVPAQHGLPVASAAPVFTSVNGVIVHALATWTDPDGTNWYVQCTDYTDGSPQRCMAILPVVDMHGLVPSTGLSNDGMYVVTYFRFPKGPASDEETTRRALMMGTFSALYGQVLGQLGLPPSAIAGLTRARAPSGGTRHATGTGSGKPDDPDPAHRQGVSNTCDPDPEVPCIPVTGHPDDPPENQPSPLPGNPPTDNPPPGSDNGGGGGGGDKPDGGSLDSWKKALTQNCIVAPIPNGPPLPACAVVITAPRPQDPDDIQPPPPVPFDWCKNAGFCGATQPPPPLNPGTGSIICGSKWVVDSAFCIHNRLRLHQTQEKQNECMAEKIATYAKCRKDFGFAGARQQ